MLSSSNIIKIESTFNDFFYKVGREINREGKEGKTYLKKYAERDGMEILNNVYGYNFQVCDLVNQEVIDGYDEYSKIGIQVTNITEKNPKYGTDTVCKFPPVKYSYLTRLKFLTLTFDDSWNAYKRWDDLDKPFFDCKNDIITLFKLKNDIINKTDINEILKIVKIHYLIFTKEFEELMNYLEPILLKANNIPNINASVVSLEKSNF